MVAEARASAVGAACCEGPGQTSGQGYRHLQGRSCFAVFLAPRWSVGRGDTPVTCGSWILGGEEDSIDRSFAVLVRVIRRCLPAPPHSARWPVSLLCSVRALQYRSDIPDVRGLVVGLIAQTRRRTVCGMLTGAGLDQVWHHSRAHRMFANARWSGDALGLALVDLIVARLLPAGAALTIAVDDTLFKRSGKKVFGVAWHHDGAAKGPKPIGFGNCWVVARHRGTATVSVPPGVPAGAGPALATAAHRENRACAAATDEVIEPSPPGRHTSWRPMAVPGRLREPASGIWCRTHDPGPAPPR